MHQIHAKRQFGDGGNIRWCMADAGEEQEGSKGGKQHIGGTELPRPLHLRGGHLNTRHSFHPEAPCRECPSDDETDGAYCQTSALRPLQMHTDVMRQHHVAQVARAIPQGRELVPVAFAPDGG